VRIGISHGRAVLAVANTGLLVPPDQVDRLFQPFERFGADRSPTRTATGSDFPSIRACNCGGRGCRGLCLPPALKREPGGKPGAYRAQRRGLRRYGVISEPGVPAEAERAVDQGLVAADRGVRADLEVGPDQLALDLLIALPGAVPGQLRSYEV
jgi:hypothetical protein